MTDTATQEAPAKRTISPEQKAKMVAALTKGRATAAANRAARAAAPLAPKPTFIQEGHRAADPPVVRRSASTNPDADLEGLTESDCANDCRDGYCVITWQNHCGHPNKGGIQAAHQMVPKIKQTYIRAKKHLAHLAVDRK